MTEQNSDIKKPTTFEEQIHILRSRNLTIQNEDAAVNVLKRINYYRLSAYMLSVKEKDRFFDKVTFDDIYDLYQFDKRLRNLLINMLESIEIAFRTHIAYILAHKYGALGYVDSNNFTNPDFHKEFINDLARELNRNDELFVTHHKNKYAGQFPIWVAIEVLPFGSISKLFSNLKNEDKASIARDYYKVPYIYIISWLRVLSYVRNICAHYGRLYDRRLKFKPRLDEKDKKLDFPDYRLFAAIFVMKKLYLNKPAWNNFVINLQSLLEEYDIVDRRLIGFPEQWEQILVSN